MRLATFKQIMREMEERSPRQQLGHMLRAMCLRYDLTYGTLRGIYAAGIRRKVWATTSGHQEKTAEYLARYRKMVGEDRPEAMLELAEAVNHQPYLLAGLLLTAIHRLCAGEADRRQEKATVKRWLVEPAGMEAECAELGLPLATLTRDIQLCVECDDSYGPLADTMRHNLGAEYEYVLHESLRNHRVSFMTETALRVANFAKTPDAMLTTPIEVDGQLVYWIDSKACFGDPSTLEKSFQDQFFQYLQRIGPGMAIYWFGFVEDCLGTGDESGGRTSNERWRADGLLLVDRFPEELTLRPDFPPAELRTVAEEAADLSRAGL